MKSEKQGKLELLQIRKSVLQGKKAIRRAGSGVVTIWSGDCGLKGGLGKIADFFQSLRGRVKNAARPVQMAPVTQRITRNLIMEELTMVPRGSASAGSPKISSEQPWMQVASASAIRRL